MKIDCSNIVNFFKERDRLTKNCKIRCEECPLSRVNNKSKEKYGCYDFINKHAEKAVEILQKWSDENQQKTIKDDFLEKYPNAPLQLGMKVPWLCPKKLGYKIDCPNYMTCDYRGYAYDYCWNMSL